MQVQASACDPSRKDLSFTIPFPEEGTKMARVDQKKQARATLDVLLESLKQDGVISAGNLKKKWQSLKGLINPKRLVFFLKKTGTKLSNSATAFLYTVRKDLSTAVRNRPELIAI